MKGERCGTTEVAAHHDHRRLRFGCHGRCGEGERREAEAGEESHFVARYQLLREALRSLGCQARVVLHQQLESAPRNRIAIARHVEANRRLDLEARGREGSREGQDQAHAHRVGSVDRGRERRSGYRSGTFQECASRC
jgi:hypothetical protein